MFPSFPNMKSLMFLKSGITVIWPAGVIRPRPPTPLSFTVNHTLPSVPAWMMLGVVTDVGRGNSLTVTDGRQRSSSASSRGREAGRRGACRAGVFRGALPDSADHRRVSGCHMGDLHCGCGLRYDRGHVPGRAGQAPGRVTVKEDL